MANSAFIVTIDGPAGVGKGTIAKAIASHYNWALLDSGSLYRALALLVMDRNIALEQEAELADIANRMNLTCRNDNGVIDYFLDGVNITHSMRSEQCGVQASKLAALVQVRQALLQKQRDFVNSLGTVAEGRDMGTVVFPYAQLKFFLTASLEARVQRRYQQLKNAGQNPNIDSISAQIIDRDQRDSTRNIAPLVQAQDALLIDTTSMNIEQTFKFALIQVNQALLARNLRQSDK